MGPAEVCAFHHRSIWEHIVCNAAGPKVEQIVDFILLKIGQENGIACEIEVDLQHRPLRSSWKYAGGVVIAMHGESKLFQLGLALHAAGGLAGGLNRRK